MRFVIVLWLCSGVAFAEEGVSAAERTERARAHFDRGKAHFNLGEFDDAVREFEAGYREMPQPLFLYNIANSARRGGKHKKALEMFKRYLKEAPDAVERPEVELRIAELEKSIESEPSPAPVVVVEKPPEKPKPDWRRDWLGATLVAVGGAALVIGAVEFGVMYPRYLARDESYEARQAALATPDHLRASLALMPIGAALIIGGAIRYAVLAKQSR